MSHTHNLPVSAGTLQIHSDLTRKAISRCLRRSFQRRKASHADTGGGVRMGGARSLTRGREARGGRHARERATVMGSGWTAPAGSAASSWRATSRRAQPAAAARERRHGRRRRARRARRRRRRRRRHAMVHGRPARSGAARSSYRSLAAAAAGRRRVDARCAGRHGRTPSTERERAVRHRGAQRERHVDE